MPSGRISASDAVVAATKGMEAQRAIVVARQTKARPGFVCDDKFLDSYITIYVYISHEPV
jgi:hypothetical protein